MENNDQSHNDIVVMIESQMLDNNDIWCVLS